jgi:endonuclease YncB( thermonuclease family)
MLTRNRVIRACTVGAYISLLVTLLAIAPDTDSNQPETQAQSPSIELPNSDKLVSGMVVRIFDGDTILIRVGTAQHRYQLLGVAAPQFIPTDRTPEPYAREARRFLELLLLDEQVYIQFDPQAERDVNNQRIAYIFRAPDMLFVNLELVRQGYAKHATRYASLYTDAFAHYGDRAQDLRRGIWDPNAGQLNWAPEVADPAGTNPKPVQTEQNTNQPTTSAPNNSAGAANTDASTDPSTIVYITKSGKSYHTQDCSHLTASQRTATLGEVEKTHQPCKTCKPNG